MAVEPNRWMSRLNILGFVLDLFPSIECGFVSVDVLWCAVEALVGDQGYQ
jgi:hypothetical protein